MSADQPKPNYPHLRLAQRAVWNEQSGLSAHARAIGAYILNRMSDSYDSAFPSLAKIASDTGYSRDTVMRATGELVDTGLFERKVRPGYRGQHVYSVNDIELLVTRITQYTDAEKARSTRRVAPVNRSPTATSRSQRPVAHSHQSLTATGTGRSQPPVPVAHSNRESNHRKDHGSDHYRDNGADTALPPDSIDGAREASTALTQVERARVADAKSELSGRINGAELAMLVEVSQGKGIHLRTDNEQLWLETAEREYGAGRLLCALDKLSWKRSQGIAVGRFPKALFDACRHVTQVDAEARVSRRLKQQTAASDAPRGSGVGIWGVPRK